MSVTTGVCLLLALIAATRGDDAVARCSQTDVTELRDALRQSACRLKANKTEGEEFRAAVRAKHGLPDCELLEHCIVQRRCFTICKRSYIRVHSCLQLPVKVTSSSSLTYSVSRPPKRGAALPAPTLPQRTSRGVSRLPTLRETWRSASSLARLTLSWSRTYPARLS